MGIGYIIKVNSTRFKMLVKIPYLILFIVLNLVTAYMNYRVIGANVDLYACRIGDYFLYYIAALSGIASSIIIFKLIGRIYIIERIGYNSIIYYSLHGSIFFIIKTIIKLFGYIEKNCLVEEFVIGLFMTLVTIIIIDIISNAIRDNLSIITGKRSDKAVKEINKTM